jgi:hypothetical protein
MKSLTDRGRLRLLPCLRPVCAPDGPSLPGREQEPRRRDPRDPGAYSRGRRGTLPARETRGPRPRNTAARACALSPADRRRWRAAQPPPAATCPGGRHRCQGAASWLVGRDAWLTVSGLRPSARGERRPGTPAARTVVSWASTALPRRSPGRLPWMVTMGRSESAWVRSSDRKRHRRSSRSSSIKRRTWRRWTSSRSTKPWFHSVTR